MIDSAKMFVDGFVVCPEVSGFQITVGTYGFKLEFVGRPPDSTPSIDCVIHALAVQSGLGRRLSRVLPILLEQDIAQVAAGSICVSPQYVYRLYDSQYGIADYLPPYAPFKLLIGSTGSLGFDNFAYQPEFRLGIRRAYPTQSGPFAKMGSIVYLLRQEIFEALTEIDRFNTSSVEHRLNLPWALRTLSRIKAKSSDSVFLTSIYSLKMYSRSNA